MARALKILVLAAIFAASSISPLSAAVKAGTVCKKVGQVSIQGKNSFKCIKSGKKLIWSIVKQTPSPKPTPTPTASPTPTPTASPIKFVPDEALVVQALFEEIWKSSATSKTKVKIEIEPARKDSDWAKQQADLTNISLELFAKMGFDIKTDSTIYIGWGFDWLNNYMPKNSWCYNATWSGGGSCGEGILFLNLKHTADWIRSGDKEIPFPSKQVQFVATAVTIHELADRKSTRLNSSHVR